MTAILTLENCDLEDQAVASEFAIKSIPYDYSIANIEIGESVSVKDLLNVMMIHSANEAAYVLAEHIGGSVEGFSDMMNEKAKELGCKNTHFVNPNGIQDENHYSTAYDLALMSRYAMQNETLRQIVKTPSYTMAGTEKHPYGTRVFTNTNHLILPPTEAVPNKYYYKDAIGIKTGYTSAAQNCLLSAASRNGTEYICVVLGAPKVFENGESISYRYLDSIALFNYCFDNFKMKNLVSSGDFITSVKPDSFPEEMDVAALEDVVAIADNDTLKKDPVQNIILSDNLSLPVKTGDTVGIVEYTIGDETYTTELVSLEDIDQPMLQKITSTLDDYSGYYIAAGVLLIVGLLSLIVCIIILIKKSRKKKVLNNQFIVQKEILKKEDSNNEEEKTPPSDTSSKSKAHLYESDVEGELNSQIFKKKK